MELHQTQIIQILNKMVFDVVNETLDSFRQGKRGGEKLPPKLLWRDTPCASPLQLPPIFNQVATQVTDYAPYMCGFIDTKDQSFLQLPFLMDEEILNQIKEDRMSKLIQNEIRDFERRIQVYDDELYEVGLEISNLVFEHLVDDVVSFFMAKDQ
jgi:hypothetical protein